MAALGNPIQHKKGPAEAEPFMINESQDATPDSR